MKVDIIPAWKDLGSNSLLLVPNSSFRRGLEKWSRSINCCHHCRDIRENRECLNCGNNSGCTICSSLYYINGSLFKSYYDRPPKNAVLTDIGVYSPISIQDTNKGFTRTTVSKIKDSILYGVATDHCSFKVNPQNIVPTQKKLILECYQILRDQFSDKCEKEEAIIYLEISNHSEPALFRDKNKITHPHVWAMNRIPNYGPPVYRYTVCNDVETFIGFLVDQATDLYEYSDYSRKIWVKLYISTQDFSIIRGEVDID